jgi:hypothetical protein
MIQEYVYDTGLWRRKSVSWHQDARISARSSDSVHYNESWIVDLASVIADTRGVGSSASTATRRGVPSTHTTPRVAIVGGLSRSRLEWQRAGAAIGAIVEHHDGDTSGARAATLAAIVRRADVVIAIAMPNSHNGVATARRVSTDHGRAFVLVKRLSPSALGAIIADALALARTAELAR